MSCNNLPKKQSVDHYYCAVDGCENTSKNTGKLFIRVPSEANRRNQWLKAARKDTNTIKNSYKLHFCEDHFDLEKDMENYMAYKLMGSVKRILIKPDCIPSKFDCQSPTQSDGPSSTKQPRIGNQGEEEISTLLGQVASCESGVKVKIEQDSDANTEEQSDQNGDIRNSLHECRSVCTDHSAPVSRYCVNEMQYLLSGEPNIDISAIREAMSSCGLIKDDDVVNLNIREEVDINEQLNDDETMTDVKLEPNVKLEMEELNTEECLAFEPCTRQMLPRVDMFAVIHYFIQNGGIYGQLDFCKLKDDNDDIYADDTIGHVEINKNKPFITLQCTVAFNRTTSHTCLMKYNINTKNIEYTSCECERQACEHIIAFLMWIHRRSEERIDNDMSFNLEPMTQETTFIRAKDLAFDNDTDTASDSFDGSDGSEIKGDIVQEFIMNCVQKKQFNSPLYNYLCSDEVKDLSMHRMACEFVKEGASEGAEAEAFISYCCGRAQRRAAALRRLHAHRDAGLRQELEYGRIDAEHFLMAAEGDEEIIDELMFPDLYVEDKMVEEIRAIIEKKLSTSITRTGIFISNENPIFCAAPYGVTDTHVVDITYVKEGQKLEDFLFNGLLTDHVKAKLQLLMYLTKKTNSRLYLGYKDENNKKQIQIHEYPYNEGYCDELLKNAREFWKKFVYMKLLL